MKSNWHPSLSAFQFYWRRFEQKINWL